MNIQLTLSEMIENVTSASEPYIKAQIKMTNTSDSYINNLKLIITPKDISVSDKCIIRQRGALCFDAAVDELDVGNLAPEETAYFEYSFKPSESTLSLSDQIILCFTPEASEEKVFKNAAEFLNNVQKKC